MKITGVQSLQTDDIIIGGDEEEGGMEFEYSVGSPVKPLENSSEEVLESPESPEQGYEFGADANQNCVVLDEREDVDYKQAVVAVLEENSEKASDKTHVVITDSPESPPTTSPDVADIAQMKVRHEAESGNDNVVNLEESDFAGINLLLDAARSLKGSKGSSSHPSSEVEDVGWYSNQPCSSSSMTAFVTTPLPIPIVVPKEETGSTQESKRGEGEADTTSRNSDPEPDKSTPVQQRPIEEWQEDSSDSVVEEVYFIDNGNKKEDKVEETSKMAESEADLRPTTEGSKDNELKDQDSDIEEVSIDDASRVYRSQRRLRTRVPIYDVAKKVEQSSSPSKPRKTCFNCLGDHLLHDCPEPWNQQLINQRRAQFRTNNEDSNQQYYETRSLNQRYSEVQPGVMSEDLRTALGLEHDQLPQYIYNMRGLGYPPGWLKAACESESCLQMFGATHVKDMPAADRQSKLNPEKLHEYPGFTTPVPPGFKDESVRYGQYYFNTDTLANVAAKYIYATISAAGDARRSTASGNFQPPETVTSEAAEPPPWYQNILPSTSTGSRVACSSAGFAVPPIAASSNAQYSYTPSGGIKVNPEIRCLKDYTGPRNYRITEELERREREAKQKVKTQPEEDWANKCSNRSASPSLLVRATKKTARTRPSAPPPPMGIFRDTGTEEDNDVMIIDDHDTSDDSDESMCSEDGSTSDSSDFVSKKRPLEADAAATEVGINSVSDSKAPPAKRTKVTQEDSGCKETQHDKTEKIDSNVKDNNDDIVILEHVSRPTPRIAPNQYRLSMKKQRLLRQWEQKRLQWEQEDKKWEQQLRQMQKAEKARKKKSEPVEIIISDDDEDKDHDAEVMSSTKVAPDTGLAATENAAEVGSNEKYESCAIEIEVMDLNQGELHSSNEASDTAEISQSTTTADQALIENQRITTEQSAMEGTQSVCHESGTTGEVRPIFPEVGTTEEARPIIPEAGTATETCPTIPDLGAAEETRPIIPQMGNAEEARPIIPEVGAAEETQVVVEGIDTSEETRPASEEESTSGQNQTQGSIEKNLSDNLSVDATSQSTSPKSAEGNRHQYEEVFSPPKEASTKEVATDSETTNGDDDELYGDLPPIENFAKGMQELPLAEGNNERRGCMDKVLSILRGKKSANEEDDQV